MAALRRDLAYGMNLQLGELRFPARRVRTCVTLAAFTGVEKLTLCRPRHCAWASVSCSVPSFPDSPPEAIDESEFRRRDEWHASNLMEGECEV
jgi:hypothetical protein